MKHYPFLWYNVKEFEATQLVSTDLKAILIPIRWQLEPPDKREK